MKVIGVVPARGGSKGIPDKNIQLLAGKPLLQYTLDAALQSKVFDQIIVSSDSDRILSLTDSINVIAHKRPGQLAQDNTPTDPVILDVIKHFQLQEQDILILLQPTSPLRTADHISSALTLFNKMHSCRGLISVYEVNNKLLKAYVLGGEFLQPILGEHTAYTRRQDLPSLYMPNGAIYIFKSEEFMREQKIPRTQLIPYFMSENESLDIDVQQDLTTAEEYLTKRK